MGDEDATTPPLAPPLSRRHGHRPAHFVILGVNILIALVCFGAAGGLLFGQSVVANQRKTAPLNTTPVTVPRDQPGASIPGGTGDPTTTDEPGTESPTIGQPGADPDEPFPQAEPAAKNFL
ncbi:MAG TPA: hypothetical protein PLV68_19710, partial [Ilumatobacteraceae bacterium]|nr:hypothetical protein [Ilumatobacteraceae bacterium]